MGDADRVRSRGVRNREPKGRNPKIDRAEALIRGRRAEWNYVRTKAQGDKRKLLFRDAISETLEKTCALRTHSAHPSNPCEPHHVMAHIFRRIAPVSKHRCFMFQVFQGGLASQHAAV